MKDPQKEDGPLTLLGLWPFIYLFLAIWVGLYVVWPRVLFGYLLPWRDRKGIRGRSTALPPGDGAQGRLPVTGGSHRGGLAFFWFPLPGGNRKGPSPPFNLLFRLNVGTQSTAAVFLS